VNTVILLLPLGGIAILGLYENELVRLTETELIAQGAVVSAGFREELLRTAKESGQCGPDSACLKSYGVTASDAQYGDSNPHEPLNPTIPTLEVNKERIRPPAPDAKEPSHPPDILAVSAAERIRPMLAAARRVTLTAVRVTDFRGTIVASSGSELGLSIMAREEVQRALTGEYASVLRERVPEGPAPPLESISRRARVRVFVAMPVLHEGRVFGAVVLSRTPLDVLKALYLNRHYLIGGGVALVAVMVLVSLLTSLSVSRPVKALIRQAEQVSEGRKSAAVPLERPGTYEVDRLSRALADMSVRLEQRADYIRAFASNVSHEFKTPLASMRGAVELLKDHFDEMNPSERDRFLDMLESDVDRLARLAKRLMELAKADVVSPGEEAADVRRILDEVVERHRANGLLVSVDLGTDVLLAAMSGETLDSVVSNLLDNAGQHGGPGVRVKVAARKLGPASVEIMVSDKGRGISPADAEKIFAPFFTTARTSGGTGLGLSIVRSLLAAHGGSISVEPGEPGTIFRVAIPLAGGHEGRTDPTSAAPL